MKHNLRKEYTSQFYRKNHIVYLLAMLSAIGSICLNFGITWLLQQILDTISLVPESLSILTLSILTGVLIVLFVAFKLLSYWTEPEYLRRAMVQYKDYSFDKLTKKNLAAFRRESSSEYLSSFSNDMNTIETNYLKSQFEIVVNMIALLGSIVMMLWYNPIMTIIASGFCLLPVLASLFTGKKLENAGKQVSLNNAGFLASLRDALSGFSVMKSFRAEKEISEIVSRSNQRAENSKCQMGKLNIILYMLGTVAAVTAQLGTFLSGGAFSASGYVITPGKLVAFLDLTGLFIMGIRELPALLAKRKAALVLIDKLAENLENNAEEDGTVEMKPVEQEIRLSHVSFAYETETPVLKDISCIFKKGKSYAVVGASGSGKSTLLNLLMGCDKYDGDIYFDTQELREISSKCLCNNISMIQQNVFVFNASIRNNITMFKEFPKEQVDDAIRLSGLSVLVSEKGEHYLCGENGCNLSGGEKQRISIARSLLRKTQILLADEATAALDAETAYQVSDAILKLTDMTRIVVTHALDGNLLSRYDEILVMKSGGIIESGSFDMLMEQKGYFYSLYTVSQ